MTALPACPRCQSACSDKDGAQLICLECGHEWPAQAR
ncbi:MAG: hypothetical protein EOP39_09890 [Rubrivivax sp.]|nr:MAG: hypothetical protein EOP39_09890 [Rubrivivax sp.]